ncbi:MAG TPA: NADH-quinone oxidoreductase subunit NuoH, partial [Dehalococcoidia bacterium]|nr:NADH-quinone oxidoreductase subunit NuoH [Dehalococcoidia bacterium]
RTVFGGPMTDDFWFDMPWLDALLRILIVVVAMTLAVLALIYLERKFIGRLQNRVGPTRTGPMGLFQSAADALKLVGKEDLRPATADRWVFELAPYVVFVPTFLGLMALPFTYDVVVRHMELALFYIVAITSLSTVGMIMAGWGSDSKYPLLGAARTAALLIGYELPLVLSILSITMFADTLDIMAIVRQQDTVPFIVWQPLAFVLFMFAATAEIHRPPFDMPVAESEIVGGPLVEYSGIRWGMFFLAEYVSLVIAAVLASTLFLGGWEWPFGEDAGGWLQGILIFVKTSLFIAFFFWIRATLPRLRIDQMTAFCWKVLLPFSLLQILLTGLVMVYDWPDVVLLVLSGIALAAMLAVIYSSVQRPTAEQRAILRRRLAI